MGLGGVILAGVGIIVVVLVANGRWDGVWAAMLGKGAQPNTFSKDSRTVRAIGAAGGASGSW